MKERVKPNLAVISWSAAVLELFYLSCTDRELYWSRSYVREYIARIMYFSSKNILPFT